MRGTSQGSSLPAPSPSRSFSDAIVRTSASKPGNIRPHAEVMKLSTRSGADSSASRWAYSFHVLYPRRRASCCRTDRSSAICSAPNSSDVCCASYTARRDVEQGTALSTCSAHALSAGMKTSSPHLEARFCRWPTAWPSAPSTEDFGTQAPESSPPCIDLRSCSWRCTISKDKCCSLSSNSRQAAFSASGRCTPSRSMDTRMWCKTALASKGSLSKSSPPSASRMPSYTDLSKFTSPM
mmetsp:Transcript_64978/g.181650  ORF Transcript_64978/g.181650 Transcript_64978/m.181650 type:complete len:238 (+) Transcript_64978:366-1079(+)